MAELLVWIGSLHLFLQHGDFWNTGISQGTVETRLTSDGIFNYSFIANSLLSLSVKEF